MVSKRTFDCYCLVMRGWTGGTGIEGARIGGKRGWEVGERGQKAGVEGSGRGGIGGGKSVTIWVRNCFCLIESF